MWRKSQFLTAVLVTDHQKGWKRVLTAHRCNHTGKQTNTNKQKSRDIFPWILCLLEKKALWVRLGICRYLSSESPCSVEKGWVGSTWGAPRVHPKMPSSIHSLSLQRPWQQGSEDAGSLFYKQHTNETPGPCSATPAPPACLCLVWKWLLQGHPLLKAVLSRLIFLTLVWCIFPWNASFRSSI